MRKSVEPPKTPSGSPAFDAFNDDGDDGDDDERSKLSASQRVRMGLSALMTHGNGVASVESDVMTRRKSHDGGVHVKRSSGSELSGPMSCPPTFTTGGEQQFSALRESPRQQYQSNLLSSKLLPSRASINSMLGYVRELYLSEASLRVELERMKRRMEDQESEAQSRILTLQDAVQRIEIERDEARIRVAEQEELIRMLRDEVVQLQLQQRQVADAINGAHEAVASHQCSEPISFGVEARALPAVSVPSALQEFIVSPRPTKPLWKPWSSGSDSPLMTAAPPMFTVAPSENDLLPASCQHASAFIAGCASVDDHSHELKSIVSPAAASGVVATSVLNIVQSAPLPTLPEESIGAGVTESSFGTSNDAADAVKSTQVETKLKTEDAVNVHQSFEQPVTAGSDQCAADTESSEVLTSGVESISASPSKLFVQPSRERKVSPPFTRVG